jgi:hypothetical protein
MLIRSSLNFAAHLAAGLAFGAVAVIAGSGIIQQSPRSARMRDAQHESRPGSKE